MKRRMEKIVFMVVVVIAIFSILFNAVNFDLRKRENQRNQEAALKKAVEIEAGIAERLGAMNFGIEKYVDWAAKYNQTALLESLDGDLDNDGLLNYLEYAHGTDPTKLDTDEDKFSDKQELINGYDPDDDGKSRLNIQIKIDKLSIDAPMIWSNSTKDVEMLKDLENGVAHFYKTASPGQIGNMIISGHSSNYAWAKGNYNSIFKDLNSLEVGDDIVVVSSQKNGRIITYKYKVHEKFITTADDSRVFEETNEPTVTLSTCWPIGTSLKRLIVKAAIEN